MFLAAGRRSWVKRWLCIEGLPDGVDVAEQGRRCWHVQSNLDDIMSDTQAREQVSRSRGSRHETFLMPLDDAGLAKGRVYVECGVVAAPDTPVMYYSTAIVEQVAEDQAAGHRRRVGYSRDSGDAADGLVVEDDRRVLDIPDPEDGGPPWTGACAHLNGKPKLFTNVLCRGKEEVL